MMSMRTACIIALLLSTVMAKGSGNEPAMTPAASMSKAIHLLKEEVRSASTEPPRWEPDFFREESFDADSSLAAKRLFTRQDPDPRIDAYVRWQLTGIAATGQLTDSRRFDRLLKTLPDLPENPLAAPRTIRRFEKEMNHRTPTGQNVEEAAAALESIQLEAAQQERWTHPGRSLRQWLIEQAPDQRQRLNAALIAVEAEIEAGWSSDDAVQVVDRVCGELGSGPALDDKQIEAFRKQAGALMSKDRLYIDDGWSDGRSFSVEIGHSTVRDYDVARWIKLLKYGNTMP